LSQNQFYQCCICRLVFEYNNEQPLSEYSVVLDISGTLKRH
jgi:hypothetical protein